MIRVIALNAGDRKIPSAVMFVLPWQAEAAPCMVRCSLSRFCHVQFWAAHAGLREVLHLIAAGWLLPIAVSVHHPNHPPS